MATVVRGERRPFGPISNDITGLAVTRGQIGGEGLCRWKMLMNGMHLEGHWNCVEYVVVEPGASIGEHVHTRTEEIYFIVAGEAVMRIDGVEHPVRAGDLITTPIGCMHAIANHAAEPMRFFVVEVFPGTGPAAPPARIHVPSQPAAAGAPDGRTSIDVDLTPHFTGDWRRFRLIELAPGAHDDAESPDRSEVLHVIAGQAAITAGGERHDGGPGLSVAVPPRIPRRLANPSADAPLRAIITELEVA